MLRYTYDETYYRTSAWFEVRELVWDRVKKERGRLECELCGTGEEGFRGEIHHTSYYFFRQEKRYWDRGAKEHLKLLCEGCHEAQHPHQWRDPANAAYVAHLNRGFARVEAKIAVTDDYPGREPPKVSD